jgi:hypothetical protein
MGDWSRLPAIQIVGSVAHFLVRTAMHGPGEHLTFAGEETEATEVDPLLLSGTTGEVCFTGPPTALCFVGPPTAFCAPAGSDMAHPMTPKIMTISAAHRFISTSSHAAAGRR